jgi:hypothetical protein
MLQAMEQTTEHSPSPSSSDFAGLLASLTSTAKEEIESASTWNEDQLGDDVVTLSYERALRNHARYRPGDSRDLRAPGTFSAAATKNRAGLAERASAVPKSASDCDRRTASVTIRLSDAECVLLRERAAEAGLTVSAYLRSCVLEVDALRAQVKEALEEMRNAGNEKAQRQENKEAREHGSKRTGSSWIQRFLGRRV